MNIHDERLLFLKEELKEYEKETPMTDEERDALHEWVDDGHSVHENPRCGVWDGNVPIDFLDTYRWEKEEAEEHAKAPNAYSSPYDEAMQKAKDETPVLIRDEVRSIRRELAHLWEFVWHEGLHDEAYEFVNDRKDDETPFEW